MAEQPENQIDPEVLALEPDGLPNSSGKSRGVHPAWRGDAEDTVNNPCAVLLPVIGLRKQAIGKLRGDTKCIVLKELPQTKDDVARCLEPALSEYARTLFDAGAEEKLRALVPGDGPTSYKSWLTGECLPAVLDDIYSAVDGQFLIAVSRIMEAIPESHGKTEATRRALAGVLTWWVFGSELMSDLKHGLELALEDRSLYWEGECEARVASWHRGAANGELEKTAEVVVVKRRRGRPVKISDEVKDAAQSAKDSGTNRDAAIILYDTHYPSPQQVKNTPTILRAHRQKKEKSAASVRGERKPSKAKG